MSKIRAGLPINVWRARGRVALILFITTLLMGPTVFAADTLRCGSRLVETGDSMEQVRRLCREPNDVSHSRLWRRRVVDPIGYRLHDAHQRDNSINKEWVETIEVQLETWTYNFGPNLFMRRIRFADGILESIETLGYGHND